MPNMARKHKHRTKNLLVGLTGSIGSGKSTAALMLQELGCAIIDADVLARTAVSRGSAGLRAISRTFGKEYLTARGDLDRARMGALVFKSWRARRRLEKILHPIIQKLFQRELQRLFARKERMIIVYVVPLLYESELDYSKLEKIIVVSASQSVCIRRIMKRDRCSRAIAKRKLASQIPSRKKERWADYVLKNDGGVAGLRKEVLNLHAILLEQLQTAS